MRPRFLFALGHDLARSFDARLSDLLPVTHESGDTLLLTSRETPVVPCPENGGWIVGSLFDRAGANGLTALPGSAVLAIASTGGRYLIERCSGSYVAAWRRPGDGGMSLLRDPTATLPAFVARSGNRTFIASDADILTLVVEMPDLDWKTVAHQLYYPQLLQASTCLTGWREMLPGERVSIGPKESSAELLWRPWTFAAMRGGLTASQCDLDQVASTIDAVVSGATRRYGRVGLELSGGLDSSILAVAMHHGGRGWQGINIATESAEGDERAYARLVAERCGAPLLEHVVGSESIDLLSAPKRLSVRPTGASYLRSLDRMIAAHTDTLGLDVLVSGTGGDNVFCSTASTAPILDAFRALGFTAARQVACNVAIRTDSTTWQVGFAVARRWFSEKTRAKTWPATARFLSRDAGVPFGGHPWLAVPTGTPAGTRAHIAGLLRIHPVLDAHDRIADHDVLFPLLSQPVMEACLAIPSWQWLDGGRDRAVARDAFATRLPAAILNRRRKGRLIALLAQAYDRSRPAIAELLGDGLLAGAGLLDRSALLACLGHPASGQTADFARILDLADAELWARSIRRWRDVRPLAR